MNYQEYIYLIFLTIIYFEGIKEYFLVSLTRYALLRNNLTELKEKKYNTYFWYTRINLLLYPLTKYKVLVAIIFLWLHQHVFHELVVKGDIHYLENLSEKAFNIAMLIAGFLAIGHVLLNPPLGDKIKEAARTKRRNDSISNIKKSLIRLCKRVKSKNPEK